MSSGIAPIDWAPSTSSVAPTACAAAAISGSGSTSPVVHSTCEIATMRVAGPIAATTSGAGTARTTTPWRWASSSSGPSRPGCSSVVVTTSPPPDQSRPAHTSPMPCVVDDVSATSSSGAPSARAAPPRARARRANRRSNAAIPIRGPRAASHLGGHGVEGGLRHRAVRAGVQIGAPLAGTAARGGQANATTASTGS